MPFIWNDSTYWDRYKKSWGMQYKVFYPLIIISFLLWFNFLKKDINFFYLIGVSILSAGVIYTFLSIFFRFPNPKIPDDYSDWGKTFMYIAQFFLASLGLYIVLVKVIFP